MPTIEVNPLDYERLLRRAGNNSKIKYVIKALLDLSDLAAADIQKWSEWSQAVAGTTMPRHISAPASIAQSLGIPTQEPTIETQERPQGQEPG